MIDTLELFYRWGIISLGEYLKRAYPSPRYTYEDCRDFDPAELGF